MSDSTKTVEITISSTEKMVLIFNKIDVVWVCKITNGAMVSIETHPDRNIRVN